MTDDVLELSTLAPTRERALVKTEADPEGTWFELADPADFGAGALSRIGKKVAETDGLFAKPKLSKAQERLLEQLLDEVAQAMLPDVPAETIRALPAITKRALGIRFFVLSGQQPLLTGVLQTLESSQPGASASMAAIPNDGSK